MRRIAARGAAIAALFLSAMTGCGSEERHAAGTLVISTAADPDYLFPPLVATTLGRQITEQIFDPLAAIGDSLNTIGDRGFVPRLARSWIWGRDSLSVRFHIDPGARWHDGVPVSAADVAFTYGVYTDPRVAAPVAPLLANIDSVTAPEPRTAVFWFRRRVPEAFYEAASEMLIVPAHVYRGIAPAALAASERVRHPVGSGRFRFARWDAGSRIVLVADSANYRGRPRLDRVIWTVASDFTTAATRLLTGEADLFEAMRRETVAQAEARGIRVITAPGFKFGYLIFNLRDPAHPSRPHPLFGDVALRRALTMAVDRTALVRSVFGRVAAVSPGPMVSAMPTSDTAVRQIPYDPARAARMLDSLGWRDHDGDGVRDRAGHELRFAVMVPTSSRDRAECAVILQEQLRRIGVRVDVQNVEIAAFVRAESERSFDSAIQFWTMDPSPGGLRQMFGSAAAGSHDGANFGDYRNARFDAELDSALAAPTLERARPRFARAYQTLIDDAPAIWLWEPKLVLGVQPRVRVARLRADAWWAHLADWSVTGPEPSRRTEPAARVQ